MRTAAFCCLSGFQGRMSTAYSQDKTMPSLISIVLVPLRYRPILRQFLRREILGRYRGSILGIAWAFITPLSMLAVYSFVFIGIFRSRWPGAETAGGSGFALRLFAGLMIFNLFAEVVGRSASMIIEQPNLVKKVTFPLELLAYVALGSALFHFFLSAGILLLGNLLVYQSLPATTLMLPIVILPLLPLLLGLSWILAALGVYIRDVGPVVGLGISLLLFLSPVFFSVQSLEPRLRFWMHLNPLTPVIENLRTVVFLGQMPNWYHWGASFLVGAVVAGIGAWLFSVLRGGFADVL